MNKTISRPPPDSDLVRRLVDFLWSEPAHEDLARELLLTFLQPFSPRAGSVSLLRLDASLRLVSAFGYTSQEVKERMIIGLWDDTPIATAIRLRQSIVQECHSEPERNHIAINSSVKPRCLIISVPLRTSVSSIGSWCVSFDDDVPVTKAIACMQTMADVVALYLVGRDTRWLDDLLTSADAPDDAWTPEPTSVIASDFSKRQRTVLRLLASGLTYDQIARRIGFSNSTVRMELLKVYRMLGVSSRLDAVARAVSLDLVDHDDLGDRERIRVGGGMGAS